MAYATYTTEALVCGSKDSHTSDRSYLLFTKDAGMLWATARSVREERSKQRFALQNFSFIRVSLVKGRSGWRIGSVEAVGNPFLAARQRKERAYVSSIVALLRRYIHGEQQMHGVYEDVLNSLSPDALKYDLDIIRQLFTIRLLHTLGYLLKNGVTREVLEATSVLDATVLYKEKSAVNFEKVIQQAHDSSQL